jgi:hypothetical protein
MSYFCSSSNLQTHSSSLKGSTPAPSTALVPPYPGIDESQTQDETQFNIPRRPTEDLKRKSASSSAEEQSTKKKIKISMGPAVDLQD